MTKSIVVDADAHIAEPADLWERNLPGKYRDRAIRIRLDDKGLEYWEFDGKPCKWGSGGVLGTQCSAGDDQVPYLTPGEVTYEEARQRHPAACDPHERIKLMDQEGFDISILYPTASLQWQNDVTDPDLAAACCEVYNDWVAEFCKPYPDRLVAATQVSLLDVDRGIKELERARKLGHKAIFLRTAPDSGIPYSEPYYYPFWEAVQDLDVPVGLHVALQPDWVGNDFAPKMARGFDWWFYLWFVGDTPIAIASLLAGGVLDRFPKLKIAVLEAGCTWLPWFFDLMDEKYEITPREPISKFKPSEYFEDHFWATMEPEERMLSATAQLVGAHKIMWASDWPHGEGFEGVLKSIKDAVAPLDEPDQQKILGDNAVGLWHLR